MKAFFHWLIKRLTIHWQSSLCSAVFIALVIMLALGIIDATGFGIATGTVLTFYTATSKDGNKVITKPEFQKPDPGLDEDKIVPKEKWTG